LLDSLLQEKKRGTKDLFGVDANFWNFFTNPLTDTFHP